MTLLLTKAILSLLSDFAPGAVLASAIPACTPRRDTCPGSEQETGLSQRGFSPEWAHPCSEPSFGCDTMKIEAFGKPAV